MTKLQTIRRFLVLWWRLTAPFWRSKERWKAGGLLALAMAFNIANIYMTVRLNTWSRDFFNALEERNGDEFAYQLGLLFGLATVSMLLFANQKYLCGRAILLWRRWLSAHYVTGWFTSKAYYQEAFAPRIDNPDQRIAEDLQLFPSLTITMIFDFVDSFGSLGAFSVILWGLSESYLVFGTAIPGFILWIALFFVIIGTGLIDRVGRPLVGIERQTQKSEADYRRALIRVQEYAKEIGAYEGDAREEETLREKFAHVYAIWIKSLLKKRQLSYFNFGYAQFSGIVPYLLAAPKYFSGAFQMGDMMQTVTAFNGVRVSLSWFILNYAKLAEWQATVDRLTQFGEVLGEAPSAGKFVYSRSASPDMRLEGVTIALPDGRLLAENLHASFPSGQRTVLAGPSGAGKSTLFYILRGIWPYGEGTIHVPEGTRLFLSQKPYLPVGTIQEILSYPGEKKVLSPQRLAAILQAVELEHLFPERAAEKDWTMVLSPGEQQRLALGRLWAQEPAWAFLDESLSAIDAPRAARILARLRHDYPTMSVCGIEHHQVSHAFYDQVLRWEDLGVVRKTTPES